MPYASQADIQLAAGGAARLVDLADWDGDTAVDPDVIARAQDASDAFIDAYLRNRYDAADIEALKATPPRELRDAAAAEAVFWLRSVRSQITDADLEVRKGRIGQLEQVRAGTLRFDTPIASRGRAAIVESNAAVSRSRLKGQW